jgi:hypothetical protein
MKQYLLLASEEYAASLVKVLPGIQFIEVQGTPMENQAAHVLVTPIVPPVPTMSSPTPIAQEAVDPPKEEIPIQEVKY